MEEKRDVIRPTDEEAIRLAKTLLRSARYGALAVLDPTGGGPLASRVGVATDLDGTPLVLVSMLSAHTRAIIADPRCSLLLGEPGKGDALAHPRVTLVCRASRLEKGSPAQAQAERRYLNKNPKAKLYVGLGDFHIFRLEVENASLNGGFGKAYNLTRDDILTASAATETLSTSEQGAVDHMNSDHRDAIDLYATHFARAQGKGWAMTGIDAEGFDLASGDEVRRIFFDSPLQQASDLRPALVAMAKVARSSVDNS
ncbi:HugZ family protein [Mesorhizobium sp. LHD-90]|uniref:HugZ family pyridoxamine 5'-phosphate oxidase n=1 Tax=Mesorhizobium sp. LHD-90 TaxID=3071414 RepID=UPI0027E11822|nr:HugZ family protein [Mesorhizobium sp. LHD-90]MDQ6436811.1 HugZ family protein [Mesorhizobium sp. LHD-90]